MATSASLDALTAPATHVRPADAFMREITDSIVSGRYAEAEVLPPEAALGAHFGVSRTIIRESMKRLEEKGLVAIQQGRGTLVLPRERWNILDPVVLSAIIAHDEENNTLDELTMIRASLESLMARQVAVKAGLDQVESITAALETMREAASDFPTFRDADAAFHRLILELSGNFLAGNIADTLYSHARHFARFEGAPGADSTDYTLEQHGEVVAAIRDGEPERAEAAMRHHILDAWRRRTGRRL